MDHIPWTHIASWDCSNCGHCCRRLKVVLTRKERSEIASHFGENAIIDGEGAPKIRKIDGRCYFQRTINGMSTCLLQKTGLKPSSCMTFPFIVSFEPLGSNGDSQAGYELDGRVVHVYGNPQCPSLELGKPSRILVERVLPEVVQLATFEISSQRYTTSESH